MLKNIFLKFLFIGVIFIGSNCLKAQDWTYLTTNKDGNDYYVKRAKSNGVISQQIWLKTTGEKLTLKKNGKPIVYKGVFSLTLYQFTCYSEDMKALAYYSYSSEGKLLKSDDRSEYEISIESVKVVPGTLGELMFNYACE